MRVCPALANQSLQQQGEISNAAAGKHDTRHGGAVDLRTCTASFTEARYFLFHFSGFKRPCISTQRSLGAVLLRFAGDKLNDLELSSYD